MVDKVARVNLSLCKGHADCVAACPVGAIFVTAGAAVQTVEVPDLNEHFESRQVPGLYVVGELGGRGLIKNAINEGKLAMEHVGVVLGPQRSLADEAGALDVLVVGSGPAGLSAGLEALSRKLRYVVLEQGSLADSITRYPRHKVLFAEPIRVPLYGDLWVVGRLQGVAAAGLADGDRQDRAARAHRLQGGLDRARGRPVQGAGRRVRVPRTPRGAGDGPSRHTAPARGRRARNSTRCSTTSSRWRHSPAGACWWWAAATAPSSRRSGSRTRTARR